ncbi:hypothetical protein [Dyadobacter sp. NIV53]|uniref:hypothetical protein n=1 Tax=Dyadobacter sp. NIV53 TaxID=2861765 RepID=UPI001C86CB73|nr:hypothetical protein [Dyadobacter sp. NIV53]
MKQDCSFIFEYRSLHLYQQSVGKWLRASKKTLRLNSDIKSTSIPMKVTTLSSGYKMKNIISLKLTIDGSKSLANYKCRVFIKDSKLCTISCDSLSDFSTDLPVENLYFIFIKEPKIVTNTMISLPLTTNIHVPERKNGVKFLIEVEFSDVYFYYKAINDQSLKITKRGIKIYNSQQRKWEKLKRVSDSTKIFSRYNDKSKVLNIF